MKNLKKKKWLWAIPVALLFVAVTAFAAININTGENSVDKNTKVEKVTKAVADKGKCKGHEEGHKEGQCKGHEEGHKEGQCKGHEEGHKEGQCKGHEEGHKEGQCKGHKEGHKEVKSSKDTPEK